MGYIIWLYVQEQRELMEKSRSEHCHDKSGGVRKLFPPYRESEPNPALLLGVSLYVSKRYLRGLCG